MPKLPPPPRRPQSRSLFSDSLARMLRPSAVTTSAADEVVAGESELPHRPADAAAEREARDAGGRDEAARGREAVRLRLVVDVGPDGAAAHRGAPRGGIDVDLVHLREIDHDPVVAGREPGDAVAPAADCDLEVVAAGEAHRGRHVAGGGAADDERRAPVVSAVPHLARLRVAGVGRGDHLAFDALSQLLHRRFSKHPRTRDCHDVPFVRGMRGVLSSEALRGLSGHFASWASRSSMCAVPRASSRAA